jgi:Las17-binding protein actin regulator
MLVMNQCGMNRLLSDKFTIGGEAAAAAGPVGREASANTDVLLRAEILSWSRSRGLFAGLSLEGATLRPDNDENSKLYGREITNRAILESSVATPRGACSFVSCSMSIPGRGSVPHHAYRPSRWPSQEVGSRWERRRSTSLPANSRCRRKPNQRCPMSPNRSGIT